MHQGFNFAPSLFLNCLHDTHLKPAHVLIYLSPINGLPVYLYVKGRTSQIFFCCHLLSLFGRFVSFSRDERPVGSLPAFAWSDVVLAQPLSVLLPDDLRFLRHPIPTSLSAQLTLRFPFWERDGLTTFRASTTIGLGLAFSPVAQHLRSEIL